MQFIASFICTSKWLYRYL